MVDVDSLTDSELRTKLIEYGFPVMPITGTTRKVMAKKLKILMENKNKANSDGRRSLGRYSSEEESDTDVRNVKRDKSRRITMAAPASKVPVRKSVRKLESDSDNEVREPSPPPARIITEEKKITTRTSKILKMAENDFDTGSDTESEVIESTYKKSVNNHEFASPSNLGTSSFLASLKRNSPARGADTTTSSRTTNFGSSSPSRYSSAFSASPASDFASDRLNQIRARLSLSTNPINPERPLYSSPTAEKDDENPDTPYLSNYTRRLSQLSPHTAKTDLADQDSNGSYSPRSFLSRPAKRDFVRDYHTQQTGKHSFKHNAISCTLVVVVVLFFVMIGVLYVGMRNDDTDVDLPGLMISYCDKTNKYHNPGKNCVLEDDLRDAVDLYKTLKPELQRLAVHHHCFDTNTKPYMTEHDAIEFAQVKNKLTHAFDLRKSLNNMEILALLNPSWELSIVREKSPGVLSDTPLSQVDMLENARQSSNLALGVLNPAVPWKCIIYNKLSAIVQIAMVAGGLFFTLYVSNTGYKYYKYHQQKKRDELFYMVERITDTLQSHATEQEDQETNFMVINHVRDMIIRINDRPRMEKIWKKAVKFINENESRVRTEMQVVQGEPYEVWRWLGTPNLNASGAARNNKSWQGQAFETQVGSVNSLPCSPTPCLKVRGMVDDGDRNLHTIKEAVLSKCAHQCRILHCAVDTMSQCVYLKCADQNDAAVAYRSLHGWWYAGNLVTVKYLRLERYMQRYPDSAVTGPPYLKALQPATDWTN